MPGVFGDHMVLQQGTTLPVWGNASPGEHVTITCGGQSAGTIADAAGKWRVTLRPFATSELPGQLIINGENRLEFHDVIAGDVWLCAGGANMAVPLSEADGGVEAASTSDRSLRCFFPESGGCADAPCGTRGHWEVCDPGSAGSFPAVGFFFARDLRASRHIPVGLINCSASGDDPISSWIPARTGGELFRNRIAPLIPYAISGVIWYQGEADEGKEAIGYRRLLPKLIRDWRARWGSGPFSFYAVSLAGFGVRDGDCVESFHGTNGVISRGWPWLREGTLCAMTLPFTGMAVTTDLGIPDDRHPPDKLNVGRRLALLARHRFYGEVIDDEGPRCIDLKPEGSRLRISFETGRGGLIIGLPSSGSDGIQKGITTSLKGFAVAGEDRQWSPATAVIEGDSVLVSSDAVTRPVAARYNWKGFPDGNLYNRSGLPAAPFRTDSDQP